MARGEDALRKLQRVTLENNWAEVQRLAKKYHRHREIGEGLSCALEALVFLVLCKQRYMERVPLEFPMDAEDWRRRLCLPEEVLEETRSILKSPHKHALKAHRAEKADADDHAVLIVSAYIDLSSKDAAKEDCIDSVVLGSLPEKYKVMKELFDLLYWLNVFALGFTNPQNFEVIIRAHSEMSRMEGSASQLLSSLIFREVYQEALLRHSLFEVETGQGILGANGLRRYLVETRENPLNCAGRLPAVRVLLRLLEEKFGDSSYRRDILEFPLADTPYQPTCRVEEIALLGLLYAQEYIQSRRSPDKERVQAGWSHLRSVVASRLSRANAFESLLVFYEMGFDSFAVDFRFYEELFEVYQKLDKMWEAHAIAISIAPKSVSAQAFLLRFPSQHHKLKGVTKEEKVKEFITEYAQLNEAKYESEYSSPILEGFRLYMLGKVQEAIVVLKKLYSKNPEDVWIRRSLFFVLGQAEDAQLWDMFEEDERDQLLLRVAIESAYQGGDRERLSQLCAHLQSIVEHESAPLSLTLTQSDPLMMRGALTDGDATSLRGGSVSLGSYSVGYQSDINLPQTNQIISPKYPTMEEWMSRYFPTSACEYRCMKLFNFSPLGSEEWPPILPRELLSISRNQMYFELLLALALTRLAQYEEALGVLQQAQRRDELDPTIPTITALIHEMRGEQAQMREQLERVRLLTLEEDVPDSAEALLRRDLEQEIIKSLNI